MKKYSQRSLFIITFVSLLFAGSPLYAFNTYVPLVTSPPPPPPSSPLSCYDFNANLNNRLRGVQWASPIRHLQWALINEGYTIDPTKYGAYDVTTFAAVQAFQQKYASDILAPKAAVGTGRVDKKTRAKLNALYGCVADHHVMPPAPAPTPSFKINNISLDNNGIALTACNTGNTDVSIFPVRVRLNGIIRDFDITGAHTAGACDDNLFVYATWGLTYDSTITYAAVVAVDPTGIYKKSQISIPLNGTASFSIPAIQGAHLSVRGLLLNSNGVQATFCNLGTIDLTSFPVTITLNGQTKIFDVPGSYQQGKCSVATYAYSQFGLTYTPGTSYTATVLVDPGNTYKESNEFDNAATIVGTP